MTIWINVSTTVHRIGPPFGIARVESAVARELILQPGPPKIGFCLWDGARGAFGHVGMPQLMDRLNGAVSDKVPQPFGVRGGAKSRLGNALLADRPDGRFPSRIAAIMRLTSRGRCFARSVWRGVSRARQRAPAGWSRPSAGCFGPGDVLITLGAEWEYGFLPLLPDLKERLGMRIIGCCHDLIPFKFPQWCLPYVAEQFPQYLKQLTRACDAIACVSDTSLRELRNTLCDLGEPVPKLIRIRLGCKLPEAGAGTRSEQVSSLVSKPFILFVSTLERRKNHEVLYRAFHRLAELHDPATLPVMVFVGGLGWGVDDLLHDISLDPLTQGLIRILDSVSDSELRILYQSALFCVFPSLDEGWGLPVAEALALGKPVICSDSGALREVGADFVEYTDPWDLPGWVTAIERHWLDSAHRRQIEEKIKRQYRQPLWSETALALVQAAHSLQGP